MAKKASVSFQLPFMDYLVITILLAKRCWMAKENCYVNRQVIVVRPVVRPVVVVQNARESGSARDVKKIPERRTTL